MAENYVVNYDINVKHQQALSALRKFQEATNKLDAAGKKLMTFQKKIESVTAQFDKMARRTPIMDISTAKVNKKLDNVILKLEKIHRLAKKTVTVNVNTVTKTPKNAGQATNIQNIAKTQRVRSGKLIPKNIGYKTLGPTMIDSGGIGAFDMVKGMGIAYGIAGLGSLMGNVLQEASDYDNIMKTTKNILGTHDKLPGFARRFQEMERVVRNVGIETKFTAPQVADASKFLAMAGFDLDAINKSIRPIADIALVGDTDLGETADVVTNIMTGYGIQPDKIRKAADIMTMTFTKSNTTLMEIAEAYKYSASLLAAGGISFEEATAGLGILGDAGIKGSQAGTTFRTIMANIVNPTKKQLGQWERIGVQRLDSNGNVRSLVDIFKDLNNADLNVSDFYNIFHKTAAQGAVSLAENVDKWNEIVRLNFLSDGVVSNLANEKKNTIQGLWYQLTSSITENGMKVFDDMQQPIRNFLQQTIDWLQTPDALKTIKSLSVTLFDLVSTLKDFAIYCIKAYNALSPLIKIWMKFQIYAWPFLAILRSFKAFGNSIMYIVSLGASLVKITGAIQGLKIAFLALKQAGFLKLSKELILGARIGAKSSVLETVSQMTGIPIENKKNEKKKGRRRIDTVTNQQSSSPFLGWSLGVVGVAALGYAIYDTIQYYNELGRAYDAWYEKVYATKGYLSEGLSPTEKYLKLVHDKQLSINQKVDEYIRLRREQMGLESEAAISLSGKTVGEAYGTILDKLKDKPWYSFLVQGASAASAWDNGQTVLANLPESIRNLYKYESYSTPSGGYSNFITRNGLVYSADKFTRDMFAATIGYDNPAAKDIIEEFTATLKQSPIEQWQDIYNRLNARLQKYQELVDPSYANLSLNEIKQLSSNDILKIPLAFEAFNDRVKETLINLNGDNENARMLSALKDLLSNQGEWSLEQQAKFLFASGVGLFGNKNGAIPGTPEWERQFGFNRSENKFVNYDSYTSQYWASTFSAAMSQAVDVINSLGDNVRGKFSIQTSPMAIAAWQQSQLNSGEPEIGAQRYINGVLHEWKIKTPDSKPNWHPIQGMSTIGTDSEGYNNGGSVGANQSNYKSHYKSDTAVPKQVIVKIENLMNVESVDLTNPDNASVIADLKSQLTQALVDVVHDFDETYHG